MVCGYTGNCDGHDQTYTHKPLLARFAFHLIESLAFAFISFVTIHFRLMPFVLAFIEMGENAYSPLHPKPLKDCRLKFSSA